MIMRAPAHAHTPRPYHQHLPLRTGTRASDPTTSASLPGTCLALACNYAFASPRWTWPRQSSGKTPCSAPVRFAAPPPALRTHGHQDPRWHPTTADRATVACSRGLVDGGAPQHTAAAAAAAAKVAASGAEDAITSLHSPPPATGTNAAPIGRHHFSACSRLHLPLGLMAARGHISTSREKPPLGRCTAQGRIAAVAARLAACITSKSLPSCRRCRAPRPGASPPPRLAHP
jgi:hypothetical protein